MQASPLPDGWLWLAAATLLLASVGAACLLRRTPPKKPQYGTPYVEFTPATSDVLSAYNEEMLRKEVAQAHAAVEEARKLTVRFKWEAVQARREYQRVNRILNAFSVVATQAKPKQAAGWAQRRKSKDDAVWLNAAQEAEVKRISAKMLEGGASLKVQGQPRKTFPQFIPASPSREVDESQMQSFKRFHRSLALARATAPASSPPPSPAAAWKVAHDASPQLAWLMNSELDADKELAT